MNQILIKNMRNEDKPRERLIKYGESNISDEELLSILFRCGSKNKSVKELSYELLNNIKNLKELRNISVNKLLSIKGIGEAKALTLIAALELGKRVYYEEEINNKSIKCTNDIYKLLKSKLIYENKENFYVILLDTKNKIISYKLIFVGTINSISIHPREVFKYAVENLANSIIVVHNHPTGDVRPSTKDIEATIAIAKLGEIIGIKLLDHVIIGKEKYYSFYENNKNNPRKS